MKQWYEELFENFSEGYEKESFTRGTAGEVDFLEKEIGYNKSFRILDVGCGTGRHSLELARRGYDVTGIDLSESMIARAEYLGKKNNLKARFFVRDARRFSFRNKFDLSIMLCEGAFPLMETDEMNFRILSNICSVLNSGGKLIMTTLNGLYPLFHSVKDFINSNSPQGVTSGNSFDLMTFREHSVYETADDLGNKKVLNCNERYYVPSEITWLLHDAGFSKSDIFGCRLGAFSRSDMLTHEDFEMLAIAVK